MNKDFKKAIKIDKFEQTIPIYSPRTAYHYIRHNDEQLLQDLTLNFDPFTINVLKTEFMQRNWEMNLVDFILILKEHLLNWQTDISNREIKLIRCLANLYEEIDLNGNGTLEWDEFTNYIIDKATVQNNIKQKNEEMKAYTKANTKLNKKFSQPITKIIWIQDLDRLAFFEEGSDEINLINHETGALHSKPLKVLPSMSRKDNKDKDGVPVINVKKAMLLDMIYIPDTKYKVLITSSNDGSVKSWRWSNNQFISASSGEEDEMKFEEAQICLAWLTFNVYYFLLTEIFRDKVNEILYSGQRNGVINIWDRKSDSIIGKLEKDGHTNVVVQMIALPKLQFLVSASYDGSIILWDTIENKKNKVYREHKKGIMSITFNESLILLFSAGFDHDILVWNPYINTSIYKISGHSSPVISVEALENTNQIVSMDIEGQLKVWDIKKFNCVQCINLDSGEEKHKFNPQAMTYIKRPLKLVIAGRTITIYEYDKNFNPHSADEYVATCAKFVKTSLSILTPVGNKVKVWNAMTGDLKKIYSDIIQNEIITAFSLDSFAKRMLIGDCEGECGVYNVINGAKLKQLTPHHSEVISIFHVAELNYIISCSLDGIVNIHNDIDINESALLRKITVQDMILSSIQYDESSRILIMGKQGGIISFWEAETAKMIGSTADLGTDEITSILSIPKIPYAFISNSGAKIGVFALPPHVYRFTLVYTYTNRDHETKVPACIQTMVYSSSKKHIFLGDDRLLLRCYDVSDVIKALNEDRKEPGGKPHVKLPDMKGVEMRELWNIKLGNDQIKSLEYVEHEEILLTTSHDKKVKIWNAEDGTFVDGLQQSYDKKEIKPISTKRFGGDEIFSPRMTKRVDKIYLEYKRDQDMRRKMHGQENQGSLQGDLTLSEFEELENDERQLQRVNSNPRDKNKPENTEIKKDDTNLYLRTAEEELNPFYYYKMLDPSQLQNIRSNDWKLNLKFQRYYEAFEQYMQEITAKVEEREKQLNEQVKRQGLNKHFNVSNYQVIDTALQGGDNKKLYQEEAENLKKMNEQAKMKEENLKKILEQKSKDKQLQALGTKFKKVSSKISSTNLHKRELKGKLIDNSRPRIKLTQDEVNACRKLAAALTNFDQHDARSLKLLDVDIRVDKQQEIKSKNFIEINKKNLVEMFKLDQGPNNDNSEENLHRSLGKQNEMTSDFSKKNLRKKLS